MKKSIGLLGICAVLCLMSSRSVFAQTYERDSESGKVRFQCEIEVPQDWNGKELPQIVLESVDLGDSEKVYANFVEGKEVIEQYHNPATEQYPEENFYILADGTHVDKGNAFGISTENYAYYGQIGATNPENMERYLSGPEVSVNAEEAVQQVKEALQKAGYAVEELDFQTYPLSAKVSQEIENQYVAEALLEEAKRKPAWTQEDDACVVYARQMINSLPVYPELSVMVQAFAYDTPDSCPVLAVYSTREIESLRVHSLYHFKETEESTALKSFDEIAKTVEIKYENILDEKTYMVERAKFYEYVYRNEAQKYTAEPVWYLELTDDNSERHVMLVNAETGKEIYLM